MNKEKIYYLLRAYTRGEYDVRTFCDVFEETFYHEVDSEDLTLRELKVLSELGEKLVRFSPYEEDLEKYPGVYYGCEEIDKEINKSILELDLVKVN